MAGVSVRASLVYAICERYSSGLVGFASLIVISRLMTPREIGTYYVGLSVMYFMQMLKDAGVSNYLLQTESVCPLEVRAVWTITWMFSWLVAGALFAASAPLAHLYGSQELLSILRVLALSMLIAPVGDIFLVLLRRELDFRAISAITFLANLAGATVSILLIALGQGPIGLAWGFVASTVVNTVAAVARHPRLSLLRPCTSGWKRILAFGFYSAAGGLIYQLSRSAPDIILGRMLGLEAVGLYGRAASIVNLLNRAIFDAIRPVVLPAFAAQARSGGGVATLYLECIEYMTVLFWPFAVLICALAEPITVLVLGKDWSAAAGIVRILSVGAISSFGLFLAYPVLVSLGRVRDCFIMTAITVPVSIGLLWLASVHSLEAVAWSTVPAGGFECAMALVYIGRAAGLSLRQIAWATRKSAAVAVVCCLPVAAMALAGGIPPASLFQAAGLACAVGGVWLLTIAVTRHRIWWELQRSLAYIWRKLRRVEHQSATVA